MTYWSSEISTRSRITQERLFLKKPRSYWRATEMSFQEETFENSIVFSSK